MTKEVFGIAENYNETNRESPGAFGDTGRVGDTTLSNSKLPATVQGRNGAFVPVLAMNKLTTDKLVNQKLLHAALEAIGGAKKHNVATICRTLSCEMLYSFARDKYNARRPRPLLKTLARHGIKHTIEVFPQFELYLCNYLTEFLRPGHYYEQCSKSQARQLHRSTKLPKDMCVYISRFLYPTFVSKLERAEAGRHFCVDPKTKLAFVVYGKPNEKETSSDACYEKLVSILSHFNEEMLLVDYSLSLVIPCLLQKATNTQTPLRVLFFVSILLGKLCSLPALSLSTMQSRVLLELLFTFEHSYCDVMKRPAEQLIKMPNYKMYMTSIMTDLQHLCNPVVLQELGALDKVASKRPNTTEEIFLGMKERIRQFEALRDA